MKSLLATAAVASAVLGFASSAAAWHFEPVNTPFTAHGSFTVTAAAVSLPCTLHMQGTTVGGAKITSATFSGVSCAALTASGLPWAVTTHSVDGATIHGVTVSATVLGICGPGRLKATVSQSTGKFTITSGKLPGLVPCSVSSTFVTKPHLRIVPH